MPISLKSFNGVTDEAHRPLLHIGTFAIMISGF